MWSVDFSERYGFDVQPLVATMHLINKVNSRIKNNEIPGLSQTEFSLFIPSLINYKLIEKYVDKILNIANKIKKMNI